MKKLGNLLISFTLLFFVFSCTKEGGVQNNTYNDRVQSQSIDGTVVTKYLYNEAGKLVGVSCRSFYVGYSYDNNERLIKVETAYNLSPGSPISSIWFPGMEEKVEFMTSNSRVNQYDQYVYDKNGRLSKLERWAYNASKMIFEMSSSDSYEYEGSVLRRTNEHDLTGKITDYHIFTYDSRGNRINTKSYSCIDPSKPELSSERTFKYDNYKNPFDSRYFGGLDTNANNLVEENISFSYNGTKRSSKITYSYQYNENGYPVKVSKKEVDPDYKTEYNIEYAY